MSESPKFKPLTKPGTVREPKLRKNREGIRPCGALIFPFCFVKFTAEKHPIPEPTKMTFCVEPYQIAPISVGATSKSPKA